MICKINVRHIALTNEEFELASKHLKTIRKKEASDVYVWKEDVAKSGLSEEEYKLSKLKQEIGDKDCITADISYSTVHVCDIIQLLKDVPIFKFEVQEVVVTNTSKDNTPELLIHKFYEMSERLNKTVDTFNQRCNVNIGGNTLIQFNTVKVELDFCTEALQKELNNGWRIIAVCVQPDGRRPDYVLGKTEIK